MRCAAPTCLAVQFSFNLYLGGFFFSCFLLFLVRGWGRGGVEGECPDAAMRPNVPSDSLPDTGVRHLQLAGHTAAPCVPWLSAIQGCCPSGLLGGPAHIPPGQSRWRPVCSCEGEGPCAVRLDVPDLGACILCVGAGGHAPVRHKWLLHPVPGITPVCPACIVGGFRVGVRALGDRLLCTPRPCSRLVAAAAAAALALLVLARS